MRENILIIDDDIDICRILEIYLNKAGYCVYISNDGAQAINILQNKKMDLIILDIMLPDTDGIYLCKKIREKEFCPIIFISCIDEDRNILKAFNKGGDDYLIKPFNYTELIARVKANLRRVEVERNILYTKKEVFDLDNLKINFHNHTIFKGKRQVHLSPIEFDILVYMFNNPNRILSYDDIYMNIWKDASLGDYRTVMAHVCNLRKKVEDDPSKPEYIKTIRKLGYIFQKKT